MGRLLTEAARQGSMPDYTAKLLAIYHEDERGHQEKSTSPSPRPLPEPEVPPAQVMLIEPLSQRELEVLRLVAQGLSNREIGEQLFLALSTVKGYNRPIFGKLQVQRRTEAVARARQLGLL